MTEPDCSPLTVHQIFQSLLHNEASTNVLEKLAGSPKSPRLDAPPAKNTIRFIENDQNNHREKYDGHRWRLVCTWAQEECKNLAYSHQLCPKHNAIRLNKEPKKKKRKLLTAHASMPILNNHNSKDNDDDIQFLGVFSKFPTARHSMNSNIKPEMTDFHVFSVDNIDNTDFYDNMKSEPRVSSSYTCSTSNDVEYLNTEIRANGLNIAELVSKRLPPLTDFEEDCIASRLMTRVPINASMLDAQLALHDEAITAVKRNYRIKMDVIAPEYFYDFLLRHPHVALHYKNWFTRCKPVPPSTGCPIDTKVWSLSMIVRGSLTSDQMIDECEE